ncbi:MAG TPA: FecR family protein [Noviherbaspirillum sp.]
MLFVVALFATASAYAAQIAGTVTHLSGPLLAKKADGTVKVLSTKSNVEQGDTLVTEKETYARIKFTDNSEITLRPNSQFKIEDFSFEEDEPEKDKASFNLVKGGLRAVTGVLGKRNKEKFGVNTPTATIGIRGTIFIAEYIPPEQNPVAMYGFASVAAMSPLAGPDSIAGVRTDAPIDAAPLEILPLRLAQGLPGGMSRAPGLYVQVLDGMISLSNGGGSLNFAAGQFGYTPSFTAPPVVLPSNPGMQFAPPPAFSSTTGPQGGAGGSGASGAVDCEVR